MTRRVSAAALLLLSACTLQRMTPSMSSGDAVDEHAAHMSAADLAAPATMPRDGGAGQQGTAGLPASAQTAAARLAATPRHGEWVKIPWTAGSADSLMAWIVYPKAGAKAPVVVVVHEIFGLSTWVRAVADQAAADGFIAIAPDFLSRVRGGPSSVELPSDTARRLIAGVDAAERNRAIIAAANYAMMQPAATQQYAVFGYCWGGSTTFYHAVHGGVKGYSGGVAFYGLPYMSGGSAATATAAAVPATVDADSLAKIKAPIMLLNGKRHHHPRRLGHPARLRKDGCRRGLRPDVRPGRRRLQPRGNQLPQRHGTPGRGRGRIGNLPRPAHEALHRPGRARGAVRKEPAVAQAPDERVGRRPQLLPLQEPRREAPRHHALRAVDGALLQRGQHRRRHRARGRCDNSRRSTEPRTTAILPAAEPAFAEPTGSNGIAIAPSNTKDRRALLLINPHTSFFFRAEAKMVSEEGLNAYGAVTWGQFFIYQGFNDRIGWMHTSSSADNIDEYLETIVKKDNDLLSIRPEERRLQARKVIVPYKTDTGMAQKEFTVYRTHHGPSFGRRRQVGEREAHGRAAQGAHAVLHEHQGEGPSRSSVRRWSSTPTRRTTRCTPTPTATSPTSTPISSRARHAVRLLTPGRRQQSCHRLEGRAHSLEETP
jgi:carboxymethylenebutenolidase